MKDHRRSYHKGIGFVSILLLFFISAVVPVKVEAQATGTISGFAKDPSGAAVPGAKVTATSLQRGNSASTVTNSQGFYSFSALEPGTYNIAADKSGFKHYVQENVTLTVNQNVRVDIPLQVGSVASTVTVTGAVPLVDTSSATVSGLVDDRRVVDLPLNGRNVIGLAVIVPGVLSVSAPQNLSNTRGGPTMDVSGGRANMNMFTFDGAYFNQASRNTGMNYPPPDAIQEFRIQTASFDAQYGSNSGGQVTVVSRSGTNQFHGSIWDFLRNDALNARNFFTPTVPAIKQNQFGGAAGGPIKKDKLFFFGSYQGLRDRPQAVPVEAFVPSAAERSGDFSSLSKTLTDPLNPSTGQPLTSLTGQPCVANNIVNPDCISPVATNLLKYVPESPSGSVVTLAPSPINDNMYFGRVDWNVSPKNTLFGHVFVDRNSNPQPFSGSGNIAGYASEDFGEQTGMVTLNDTYTLSPTLLNQSVVSYLRETSSEDVPQNITLSSLGINMPQYAPTGALDVSLPGFFELGAAFNSNFYTNTYELRDALTWMKGKHDFRFGGEYLRVHGGQRFISSPTMTFTGAASGNPMSDFLLGTFDSMNVNFGVAENDDINNAPSFFFQDSYKIVPRFTLTYGVRYEPNLLWYDGHDRINKINVGVQSTVVPDAPPGILFPGDPGTPRTLVPRDWNNIAPRIGFAWDVFGNGKTAVRGAYGVFYDATNYDTIAQQNAPFAGNTTIFNGLAANPFTSIGLTNPPVVLSGQFGCSKISAPPGYSCPLFPLPATGFFMGGSLSTPYTQDASLTIQHQLTSNTELGIGYIGKWGIKLPGRVPYNPAVFVPGTTYNPATGSETTVSTPSNANSRAIFEPGILSPQGTIMGNPYRSWYNSFFAQVTKRMSHGFSLNASYTLAKSIDMLTTITEAGTISNPFDLDASRGRSTFDVRNAFVASYLWSPPIKFNSRWKETLLGHWTFAGITTLQSGSPITFISGKDIALDGTGQNQNAFVTGQPIAISHSSTGAMVQEFFNTGAFVNPLCSFKAEPGNPQVIEQENCTPLGIKYSLLGQFGNSGRGILSGPASYDTDFSILKDFPIRESERFQFRAEAFNTFNHPNFGLPNSNVSATKNFGRITSADDGRVIQLALKFYW